MKYTDKRKASKFADLIKCGLESCLVPGFFRVSSRWYGTSMVTFSMQWQLNGQSHTRERTFLIRELSETKLPPRFYVDLIRNEIGS